MNYYNRLSTTPSPSPPHSGNPSLRMDRAIEAARALGQPDRYHCLQESLRLRHVLRQQETQACLTLFLGDENIRMKRTRWNTEGERYTHHYAVLLGGCILDRALDAKVSPMPVKDYLEAAFALSDSIRIFLETVFLEEADLYYCGQNASFYTPPEDTLRRSLLPPGARVLTDKSPSGDRKLVSLDVYFAIEKERRRWTLPNLAGTVE